MQKILPNCWLYVLHGEGKRQDSVYSQPLPVYFELFFFIVLCFIFPCSKQFHFILSSSGRPLSNVTINNKAFLLNVHEECQFETERLPVMKITFCTSNLNSPVQTMAVDHNGIYYFVNQACGTHTIYRANRLSNLIYTFTYSDKCERYHTFMCSLTSKFLLFSV